MLVGCNKKADDVIPDNISRETLGYLAGENEDFAVTVESGRREKFFIADGKATDVESFTQITVTPLKSNEYQSIAYELKGGESALSGTLTPTAFQIFTASISLNFAPTSVTVTAGDTDCEIELSDVLEGALTSSDAINIAKEAFKDKIEKEASEGKPEREIYLKLISGDRMTYYYYVSFIGEGVDYWAMLIDPHNGKIITKK